MSFEDLQPGEHVAIVGGEDEAIEARTAGLQFRDTLLVLLPGPSSILVLLFRKPIEEGTVVSQILATGEGGLNIGACRVSTNDKYNRAPASSGFSGIEGYRMGTGRMSDSSKVGRWPANLALIHSPKCTPGTARVKGHKGYPNGPGGSSSQLSQKGTPTTRTDAWEGYADAEGKETVPAWTCVAECPVGILDGQSGELKSGAHQAGSVYERSGRRGGIKGEVVPRVQHEALLANLGGASRFYPQFSNPEGFWAWVDALLYR